MAKNEKLWLSPCVFKSYGLAHACIGHLDVKHSADSGSKVNDAGGLCCGSMWHMPTHEHERDVTVVWVPGTMSGALVVALHLERKESRLSHHHNVATAPPVITIDKTLLENFGD